MYTFSRASSQHLSNGPLYNIGTNWSFAATITVASNFGMSVAGRRATGGWQIGRDIGGGSAARPFFTFYGVADYYGTTNSMPTNATPFPFVVRKAGSSLTFYISGSSAGTVTVGTQGAATSVGMLIGQNGSSGGYWDGDIKEVAIWDEDIGTAGVSAYGAGTSPLLIGTKIAYYFPLDRNDGPLAEVNTPTFTAHTRPALSSGGNPQLVNGGLVRS